MIRNYMNNNKLSFKVIALVMSFCLIVSGLIFINVKNALAASAPNATGKITTSGGAYIRKSASTTSSKVKLLGKGKTFTISFEKFLSKTSTSKKNIWYYTNYKGYVRADLASISYKTQKAYTTESLNARSGAGTKFKVQKTFKKGATIYVVLKAKDTSNKVWYKIKYGSKYYYVSSSYVKFTSTTSSSTTSSVTSYVKTGTTTDSLNARSGAGTKYAIKKTYAKGTKLSIVGKTTVSGAVWYKLSNGYYVLSSYVKIAATTSSSSSSSSSVTTVNKTGMTTDYINARSGPSTGYAVKTTYSTGTKVTITGQTTTSGTVWYKLSNGYYVCGDYITFNLTTGTVSGFPASYTNLLNNLKAKHPNWVFKPVSTGLDWNSALSKMKSTNANTIHSVYNLSYRDVGQGSYNFSGKYYIAKDGSSWFKASPQAVAYYMDPRNWLNESSIFMFEDHAYNSSYQTSTVVQKVLANNSTLKSATSSFISAGKTYNINPVYLASKSYNELGGSAFMINGHQFTYSGKTFSGCYNAFNIGATDTSSGSAAINGLVYANGGYYGTSTSYGRKWSSLSKAISGGAKYIAEDFVENDQDTGYLEHFNVMNGLSNVGTHVYMTAIYAPNSMASTVYDDYKSYGILNEKIVFKIPVYNNMPTAVSPKPGSGNNNCYLSSLNFTYGSTTKTLVKVSDSSVYNTSFSASVANSVKSVTINATRNDSAATITSGTGTKSLAVGKNTFYVKCKSSSGITRTYTIVITRNS